MICSFESWHYLFWHLNHYAKKCYDYIRFCCKNITVNFQNKQHSCHIRSFPYTEFAVKTSAFGISMRIDIETLKNRLTHGKINATLPVDLSAKASVSKVPQKVKQIRLT